MSKTEVCVGGKTLKLSSLDKVLYPSVGFSKGDMVEYYDAVSPVMLTHVRERPIALKRFPDGVEGKVFFQKNCPSGRPEWVSTAEIETQRDSVNFCVLEDAAGLVWLANLASIEIHPLLARRDDLSRPTHLVFDLDPGPPAHLPDCLSVALRLRAYLEELGLASFPKTSGGKGVHVLVPLNTEVSFDETKQFARAVAHRLEELMPRRVTANMRKTLRRGKVLIDWSQNDDFKSTVAPYSLRARERPTVSTPVTWDEIAAAARKKDAARLVFDPGAVRARIDAHGDLLAPMAELRQSLDSTRWSGEALP